MSWTRLPGLTRASQVRGSAPLSSGCDDRAEEEDFHFAARGELVAKKAGRENLAFVGYEQVGGAKVIAEVVEVAVLQFVRCRGGRRAGESYPEARRGFGRLVLGGGCS